MTRQHASTPRDEAEHQVNHTEAELGTFLGLRPDMISDFEYALLESTLGSTISESITSLSDLYGLGAAAYPMNYHDSGELWNEYVDEIWELLYDEGESERRDPVQLAQSKSRLMDNFDQFISSMVDTAREITADRVGSRMRDWAKDRTDEVENELLDALGEET